MRVLGIVFSNLHDKEIGELTANRTLASVPFGGRFRLIDFALSNMVNSDVNKVGVITKYNYQSLMDHVGSGKHWDLSRKSGGLTLLPPFGVDAGRSLYTSRLEALQNVETFIRRSDEEYIVMSDCDVVCNVDFAELVQAHVDRHSDVTVLYRHADIDPEVRKLRTVLDVDIDGRVTTVTNSEKLSGPKNVYANMMVVNREFLLNLLENSREMGFKSFSHDLLPYCAASYRMFALPIKGYSVCIDSLANYFKASMQLLNKDIRDGLFYRNGAYIYTKVRDSAPCSIASTASVSNSLIADGCVIEGEVRDSILFRGVRVAKGAVVRNSIVFQDTVIGEGSQVNCVIADKQAKILENRLLSGHSTHPYFIAKNCVI